MTKAGACYFCGGGHLSREHVWPDWARSILPQSEGNYTFVAEQPVAGARPRVTRLNQRQGDLTATTVRVVCRRCNNGWMSQIEEQAKPIVSKLILGEPFIIVKSDREILSSWLTMKLMVLDGWQGKTGIYTPDERKKFLDFGTIPQPLNLWILTCGEFPWYSAYSGQSQFHGPENFPTKLCVWGFGEAVVVAFYAGGPLKLSIGNVAAKIWPDCLAAPFWPRPRARASYVDEIVGGLDRKAEELGNHWWKDGVYAFDPPVRPSEDSEH